MDTNVFTTLAWYNTQANATVCSVIAQHRELAAKPGLTYFGSIVDLLRHVVSADLSWLRRTAGGDAGLIGTIAKLEERLRSDASLDGWLALRPEVDAEIERFCAALEPGRLVDLVHYANNAGKEFDQPRWQCLLHMFNHQTHHRGQLAQLLDEHEITNDYSNLIWYLRDAL